MGGRITSALVGLMSVLFFLGCLGAPEPGQISSPSQNDELTFQIEQSTTTVSAQKLEDSSGEDDSRDLGEELVVKIEAGGLDEDESGKEDEDSSTVLVESCEYFCRQIGYVGGVCRLSGKDCKNQPNETYKAQGDRFCRSSQRGQKALDSCCCRF
ncbi:MAG: hypothetical protein ABH950_03260 [Candidatus Altiarchaeota archaeon]